MNNHILRRWLIVLIFVLGLTLRFWLFFTEARFPGDTARDMLVGSHIVKYGELPLVGHFASGNWFYYPPYYFYLHAVLFWLLNDARLIIALSIVWQSFSILFTYGIARLLFSSLVGVIAATIVATSQYFVRQQSWLYSGPLATPLFLAALMFAIVWVRNKKSIALFFCLCAVVLAGLLSYTPLLYLPIFLSLFSILGRCQYGTKKLVALWVVLIGVVILLYSPLYLTYPDEVVRAFNPLAQTELRFNAPIRLAQTTKIILEAFVQNGTPIVYAAITAMYVIAFYYSPTRIRATVVSLLGIILYPLVLGSMKTGAFSLHYFDAIMPIIIVVFSWSATTACTMARSLFVRGLAAALLLASIIGAAGGFNYEPYEYNQYQQTVRIAQAIMVEAKRIQQRNRLDSTNFYHTYVYQQNYESWINGPMIWYQIERITSGKLVSLIPKTNLFTQLNTNDIVFLYCLWYDGGGEDPLCQQDFLKEHPKHEFRYAIKIDPYITVFVYKRKDSSILL